MRPSLRRAPVLCAVAVPLLVYLAVAAWSAASGTPLLRGDCPYYYATARSLLDDGDLDLGGQIVRGPVHSGQISFDVAGRPVPKHPPVLPLLALPLIAAAGTAGALIFNLLQLALVPALVYALALRVAGPAAAATAALLTGVASFLPAYAWNFSPDVLTTVLLLAALVALPAAHGAATTRVTLRHAAAGLALGLACVAKLSFLLLLPALLLLAVTRRRPLLALAAGLALPLALYGLLNLHLFGAPWTTSYDRIGHLQADGSVRLHSHRQDFTGDPREILAAQLLDGRRGLLWTAPLSLVGLAALPLLWRRRRRLALAVVWVGVALLAFYARYDWWWTSEYGNRFLMPLVALAGLPLAALAQRVMERDQPAATRTASSSQRAAASSPPSSASPA